MKTLNPSLDVKIKYIRRIDAFKSLPPSILQNLAKKSFLKSYDKNENVFSHEEPALILYILIRGTVQIYKNLQNGEKKVLHLVDPNNLLAEAALFLGKNYPANGKCISDSLIMCVYREDLISLTSEYPEFPWKILGSIYKRLKEFKETIENNTLKSSVEKVAVYILQYFSNVHNYEYMELNAPKKEIANYLGLRPESFSRAIRAIQNSGAITNKKDRIYLLDREKLYNIISEGI